MLNHECTLLCQDIHEQKNKIKHHFSGDINLLIKNIYFLLKKWGGKVWDRSKWEGHLLHQKWD